MEKGDENPTRRHKMSSRLGIILVLSIIADTASCDEQNKYPIQVHQMFQERTKFGFQSDQRVKGSWGSWSPWSECSRSCGTGVQSQSRECIPYREYSQRKRSIASFGEPKLTSTPYCIGNYMRYHVCNTQDCTYAGDLRAEQCAAYDAKLYKGRSYQWEPFLDAPNECALNCRAIGERFYATLQKAVLDGTPCRGSSRPTRTPGVLAPGATANRWLCVAGQCKAVGCDGVIGSQRIPDACGVCGGEGNSCRLFEGIFLEPKLPKRFHLVTTIPKGAVSLNISEVQPAGTVLALKESNGSYILNGVRIRSPSGYYKGVGTTFVYRHGNSATVELIWSEGPLARPVDLMILAPNMNPGVLYKYQLPLKDGMEERALIASPVVVAAEPKDRFDNEIPEDTNHLTSVPPSTIEWNNKSGIPRRKNSRIPSPTKMTGDQPMQSEMRKDGKRRRKGKKFTWTIAGTTPCSKACGGGVQRATFKCFRITTQVVAPDRRCKGIPRPASPPPLRCNTRPCPARWRAGAWSECSVTCGRGVQTRVLECVQELNDKLTMRVADGACIETSTLKTSAPCEQPACNALAAPGGRQQPVSQVGISSGGESGDAPRWSTGSWGPCSRTCGEATRKRRVTCITSGTTCSPATKPTEEATCDLPSCEDKPEPRTPWLYTDWSKQCSVECGVGFKTRQVACSDRNEVLCDVSTKPAKIESCTGNGTSCSQTRYQWFVGVWSACTATCGTGTRRRDVVCLAKGPEGFVVSADKHCANKRPIAEELCTAVACPAEWFTSDWSECSKTCGSGIQERAVRCLREGVPTSGCSELSEPTGRRLCNTESCKMKHPLTPGSVKDGGVKTDCVDLYRSCDLVLKAKLCRINYYKRSCCKCRDR